MQASKLIMAKDDFEKLIPYFSNHGAIISNLRNDSLLEKIHEAELVEAEDFPWEIVRLNTKVVIRDKEARYNFAYTVVLPEDADHRKCMVSVFSPIGSALFGYKRGDDTYWQTSNGRRYFTIMAISQGKQ